MNTRGQSTPLHSLHCKSTYLLYNQLENKSLLNSANFWLYTLQLLLSVLTYCWYYKDGVDELYLLHVLYHFVSGPN